MAKTAQRDFLAKRAPREKQEFQGDQVNRDCQDSQE